MEHHKHAARLPGLFVVAALGVMAFAASAGAVAPGFLINKKPVGSLLANLAWGNEGVSTMLVPGLNFKLSCTTLKTDMGAIESNTSAVVTLLYTGCTTLSISDPNQEIHCHVTEPLTATGIALPAEIKKPVLDAPAILIEKVGLLFKLHLPSIDLGKEICILPLDNTGSGEICFEIRNNDTAKPLLYTDANVECLERVTLEGVQGAGIKDVLKYGAQTMTLDGAMELSLTGAHSGQTLGVSLY